MSDFSLPGTAVRFNVPQYCEWDPVELAVNIRDDCPGGCIIYGRFDNSERWHANVSARSLVRLLMEEGLMLSGECGAEISGNLYCLDCSNVTACDTCGDRDGGCPYCRPDAGWAK